MGNGGPARQRAQRRLDDAKFGLFVHWGAYAVGGIEASWPVRPVTLEKYEAFPQRFTAERFDAGEWVDLARDAASTTWSSPPSTTTASPTPFVDRFIADNYPGRESEMFDTLAATQPIGRMGTPTEIAGLAVWLCSDEASFVTGSNHLIDGGFTGVRR